MAKRHLFLLTFWQLSALQTRLSVCVCAMWVCLFVSVCMGARLLWEPFVVSWAWACVDHYNYKFRKSAETLRIFSETQVGKARRQCIRLWNTKHLLYLYYIILFTSGELNTFIWFLQPTHSRGRTIVILKYDSEIHNQFSSQYGFRLCFLFSCTLFALTAVLSTRQPAKSIWFRTFGGLVFARVFLRFSAFYTLAQGILIQARSLQMTKRDIFDLV